MEEYKVKYERWLNDPAISEVDKQDLKSIASDEKEIEDRFYKDLEFGTAGLRGVIGIGTNRMNTYTVTKASQGIANYIIKKGGQNRGVVIAYDSRRMSPEFSEQAALCLNANGIKTYRFDTLRPTPELSFAVRELGCIAGIVVTASHNPPEYNGYKVYWEDGAQIVEPTDKEIIEEVNNVTDLSTIKTMERAEAESQGLYHTIGSEIDKRYIEELKKLVVNQKAIDQMQKDIKIVYTPLHGTGNIPVQAILKELGFENVYIVKEQAEPDGNFPTVDYPNPEDPKAFKLALELAKEKNADIILANDPDADRLGVYAKNQATGEYIQFNGNMTGNLIAEYILSQKQANGTLPSNGAVIKTIVSSNLTDAIAKSYNVKLFSTLTGFKNIAKIIRGFEENNNEYECLYSYEESYGCIIGTHARDKDGIVAVMTLCEAACYYKQKGMTLWDAMLAMYEKYGYYKEKQFSITLKGAEGAEQIKQMMEKMRNHPATEIAGERVIVFGDYQKQNIHNNETGEDSNTNLPKSNVLYFDLTGDSWCCVRPSGTEPKIKFYMGVKGTSSEDADKKLEELEAAMKELSK
ncbi:MAG: phospho-sugar mutase [Clostridia bacterium]|nr:phospho-sugar mutase [Clostridia bacterium]